MRTAVVSIAVCLLFGQVSSFTLSASDVTPVADAEVDSPSIPNKVCFEFMDKTYGGSATEREGAVWNHNDFTLDLSKDIEASAMLHLGGEPVDGCLALVIPLYPSPPFVTGWNPGSTSCDLQFANTIGVKLEMADKYIKMEMMYLDPSGTNGLFMPTKEYILASNPVGDIDVIINWDSTTRTFTINFWTLAPFVYTILPFYPLPGIGVIPTVDVNSALTAKTTSEYDMYFCDAMLKDLSTPPPASGAYGDPHFMTWSGERYDFHGICDLVLLTNPEFKNGTGMDIHIRTQKTRSWSFIEAVAIRIRDDTLEIVGGVQDEHFWLNGVSSQMYENQDETMEIGGHAITFKQINDKARLFVIDLGNNEAIEINTWNSMVRVLIKNGSSKNFASSLGLMGTYDSSLRMGRDNKTVIDDVNDFGMEWQVLSTEPVLFHNLGDVPHHPERCEIPTTSQLRRRLGESPITKSDAELACSRVNTDDFDLCVFDVMAMNSKDAAGAY